LREGNRRIDEIKLLEVEGASQLVTRSTRHSPKSYDELTGGWLKHRVVTSWRAPQTPRCHYCDELTACCCRRRLKLFALFNSPYTYDITSTYQVYAAVGQWTTASDAAHQRWCRRQWTVLARVSHTARTGVRLDGVVVFAADDGCQSSPTFARSAVLALNCCDAARQVSANVYAEVKGLASDFSFTSRTTLARSAACTVQWAEHCVCLLLTLFATQFLGIFWVMAAIADYG